ncbi:hypothetical protein FSARC_8892 [Fusarium sarcochroum]|uniref:Peroxidase n=1 Tax=Fusarium sarcochroum TaxID=1208366 RepID=A0A8H4X6R8_9HYPO|nr:hypothetical protein FSARC_8892 [Fusarium sarcochroum]
MKTLTLFGLCLGFIPFVSGRQYIWPSEYDEIEDIFSLQSGYLGRNFSSGVTPCSQGGNVKGRQNAAQWIRTAFHDVITHEKSGKTGGLDASIFFETTRPENNARAFNNTFNFFNYLTSTKASAADLLAMSVVVSHSACGGKTKIPFRYGRLDADEAGPFGVPEAHSSLDTTLNRFKAAGFNKEEMITLVACGHTLGGVHSNDFPQIVPGSQNMYNDTVEPFDSSPHEFDNKIATDYVQGSTSNPLVIGANNTLNSDKRIFSSDRNKTIQSFAKKASLFESRCAKLFEQMIDTVPRESRLSSPLESVDIKPYIVELSLNGDFDLIFRGRVRVRTTEGARAGRDPTNLAIHLTYSDRRGKGNIQIETTCSGASAGLYGETFAWYEFSTTIEQTKGISKFKIHLTVPSSGKKTTFNNQGKGYPIDDTLLYQSTESCVARTSVGGYRAMTATVAVIKEKSSLPLTMNLARIEKRSGTLMQTRTIESIKFEATEEERGGYIVFKAPLQLTTIGWNTNFDIKQNGKKASSIPFLKTQVCSRT